MANITDYVRDLFIFAWAIINNWAGYTTGGLIVALVWLWSTLKQTPISRKVGISLAILFLFFAIFTAWRAEYLKTRPGIIISPQMVVIGTSNNSSDAKVLMFADLANRGAPNALDTWQLETKLGDAKPIISQPFYIDPNEPISLHMNDGSVVLYDSTDALYNKTKPGPLPTGSLTAGLMGFIVVGKTKPEIERDDTVFFLRCRDVNGELITSKPLKWIKNNIRPSYLPGLKAMPEKK